MTRFTSVSLNNTYTHSRSDSSPWEEPAAKAISILPGGSQKFWGVPFDLGSDGSNGPGLLIAGEAGSQDAIVISVEGTATHLVFAQVCDSRARTTVAGQSSDYVNPAVTAPGEHLADYVIVYADGYEARIPVRRRFEVNQVNVRSQSGFVSRQHQDLTALEMRGPYPENMWGRFQTGVTVGPIAPIPSPPRSAMPTMMPSVASWSVYAMPNPHPDKPITAVRIEPTGATAIGIGGLTLFSGEGHPLRQGRLESYDVELGDGEVDPQGGVSAEIELGVIARNYFVEKFDPQSWLENPVHGWGEFNPNIAYRVGMDISATPNTTLKVEGHDIELGEALRTGSAVSGDGKATVRLLTPARQWVHGRIIDASTGKPTPARVHFRSPDGRYFPPYGHRHEVNDNWFEDYGADLKLGQTPYAYVDGTFQGELPVGEVYAEVSKGFEYQPVRQKLEIKPGQRELEIRLDRIANKRSEGWMTADTHVHFISTETARLESAAEDLNVINLLAAQWGDLFTNVADHTGELSGSSSDDVLVWVGSENRQHFLGHISLLGARGGPIYPMSTSGPTEGYIGDGTELAMSEWADRVRAKGGIAIVPHFPHPHSEVIAEVVLGKVDGLEIRDFWSASMDTFGIHEWYRMLNCGYRIAVVGGTDKMSAGMPVGGSRTYAHIGDDEFSYDAWTRAVRAGRTVTTTGPLLDLKVEGAMPGDEITMPAGGGTLHVEATSTSTMPVHALEIVFNGRVVAQERAPGGASDIRLSTDVQVPGSGWIAARAISEHRAWHVWPVNFGAHTSPVYVVAKGSDVFSNDLGEYLITTMQGGLEWLDTLATRDTPERHARIKQVFHDAIADVRGKQATHGHPH